VPDRPQISLDNPIFNGRLRQNDKPNRYVSAAARARPIVNRPVVRPVVQDTNQLEEVPTLKLEENIQNGPEVNVRVESSPVSDGIYSQEPSSQQITTRRQVFLDPNRLKYSPSSQPQPSGSTQQTLDEASIPLAPNYQADTATTPAASQPQQEPKYPFFVEKVRSPPKIKQLPGKLFKKLEEKLEGLNFSKTQWIIVSSSASVFLIAVIVGVATIGGSPGHSASDLSASYATAGATSSSIQSTSAKPTTAEINNYTVAEGFPRYINIPILGVHARVLSESLENSDTLNQPNNIYDTGWYDASSLPGQSGAMLIDGHISDSSSHGVFYGINSLDAGNIIQIVSGGGQTYNYDVVRTEVLNGTDLNIKAAVKSIDQNVPGLNLISSPGDVIPGTNSSNQLVVAFAILE
jgi:sortase (surface protein transpeptidase)